jgi:hypothetical protein
MSPQQAKIIIDALSKGLDPETGEVLPDETVFNHPQVIRSLFIASQALNEMVTKGPPRKNLPDNAGKPWSAEDDEALIAAFDQGLPMKEIAAKYGRTNGSIASRLVRLGCIVERGDPYQVPGSSTPACMKRSLLRF